MKFQKRKLSNGITILFEERDLPIVSLSISNPYAASHENSKIKGIAHFIEHLLFTGTETRTHEDISREVEKKGGVLNAFTAQDVTSYWFKLPSEHVFAGLDIITDMLKNPKFDPEKFEKEKKVILEEIKMYHDMPQRHIHDKILENLYEKPFGEGIIGSKETVSVLTRDFVYKEFEEKYSPENYIVTIVGSLDFEKVCDYLEKTFQPKNKPLKTPEIKKKNAETTEERPGLDQAHFVFAIHAPQANDPKIHVLEVLDAYLANGMSSRLFLEIREKRGLAYAVRSSIDTEKNHSHYSIYVGTTKEAIPEVKKIIIEEFDLASKNMTPVDLKEAQQRLIGLRKVTSEESTNVMNELVFAEISTGNAENYYKYVEEIKKVTLEQVKELAKIDNYSTAAIVPE
ncbi:MAG: insulinase family protein [Nanoarchaeota archaeon]|nr:insulinase family protein [Nanoarchaeota archaeon]